MRLGVFVSGAVRASVGDERGCCSLLPASRHSMAAEKGMLYCGSMKGTTGMTL